MSESVKLHTVNNKTISFNTCLFINGKFVSGRGEKISTINPATEEPIVPVDTATADDVQDAVKSARECFETAWGTNVTGAERGRLLHKLADEIEAIKDELALIESLNAGKPIEWCKFDIDDSIGCLRFYAGAADKIHGASIEVDDPSKYAVTRKEPIGVCAQIVPWNYPIMMMAWKIAPALASGCTIVFKPSELTPLSAMKIASLFPKAGYPAGVFNLVNGAGPLTGTYLSSHPDIDKIAFTGSTAVGKEIVRMSLESNLKKVSLELGGKSPNIIFEKADLEEAAKWAAFGVFENAGQTCTAGSRILVQDSIYDKFLELFVKATEAYHVGDPLDSKTFQGPQVSKRQFDRVMEYISVGKKEGARVVTGGERHGSLGYFIQPTVFVDVEPSMRIAKEEIFGPVAAVIRFKTEGEAIELANSTSYGLASGIHSSDIQQVNRVSRKLKAGTVWVNQYVMLNSQVPFGGYKQSGWGRELGMDGLENYLTTKAVHYYYGDKLEWPVAT
ncbi:aldehyde dehydrogenase domain-containing protein [Melampsora americana]|nr:aldehyde dehydrogenase domain-containing protein [Melampsora americana]